MTYDLNPRVIVTDALLICFDWRPYLLRQLTCRPVKTRRAPVTSRHVRIGRWFYQLLRFLNLGIDSWQPLPMVKSHSRRRWARLGLAISAALAWEAGVVPPAIIFPIVPYDCTGQLKRISLPSSSPPLLPPICVINGVSAAPARFLCFFLLLSHSQGPAKLITVSLSVPFTSALKSWACPSAVAICCCIWRTDGIGSPGNFPTPLTKW